MTPSREKTTSAGRRFGTGVLILTAAAVVTKIIGLLFRIPLLSAIGMEGMAYFLAANHFYIWFYTLATAGLPVAISILVAQTRATLPEEEAREGIAAIWFCASRAFLLLGALGTAGMLLFAPTFAELTGIRGAVWSVYAIAPTLLFVCMAAAVRGYFQGHAQMLPTAISELFEAGGKLFLGLGFAALALRAGYDTPVVAAFAIAGITAGALASMLYLLAARRRFLRRQGIAPVTAEARRNAGRGVLKKLLAIAAPVTLSSSVIALAGLVDTLLISSRLQAAGVPEWTANAWYSCFGNLAVPLYNLAPALIGPVAMALIPTLTAAVKAGRREEEQTVLSAALRISSLVSMPAALGLAVFGEPVLGLLFPGEELVPLAARLLSVLALSIPLAAHMTVSGAVLQAYGHPSGPIWSMTAGTVVKIAAEYLLVGHPAVGIYGAPISTFLCNATVMAVNYYQMKKYAPCLQGMGILYARPLCASVPAVGGALAVFCCVLRLAGSRSGAMVSATLAALAAAGILYLGTAFRFRALTVQDLALLPGGDRLIGFFRKRAGRNAKAARERTSLSGLLKP